MAGLAVVLDANVLIRFAIGRQVPRLRATYAATVDFLAPDTAFIEAKRSLPTILRARGHPGVGEAATGHGGRIDLLAIAPDGSLVLIELKRDRTPREIVAQALD